MIVTLGVWPLLALCVSPNKQQKSYMTICFHSFEIFSCIVSVLTRYLAPYVLISRPVICTHINYIRLHNLRGMLPKAIGIIITRKNLVQSERKKKDYLLTFDVEVIGKPLYMLKGKVGEFNVVPINCKQSIIPQIMLFAVKTENKLIKLSFFQIKVPSMHSTHAHISYHSIILFLS